MTAKVQVLTAVGLLLLAVVATTPAEPKKPTGVFVILQKSQTVLLKDLGSSYEITVIEGTDLGFKVMDVGADYLVLQDIAGVIETRIPIYAVKSVKVLKKPK